MFAKNVQGNYRRIDNASIVGVASVNAGAEWHVFVDTDNDSNRLLSTSSETEARDYQDSLARAVGVMEPS